MTIRKSHLALIISLFVMFSGCSHDQVLVSNNFGTEEISNIKISLIGKWNLFSDEIGRLPRIIDKLGDKNFTRLSSELIFNNDDSFVSMQSECLEGYEKYPAILTSKGFYGVDSTSIISFKTTYFEITIPDETKQILIDEGMYSENPEVPRDIESSFAFKLEDNILTIFMPIQNKQGAQTIDSRVYVKEDN